mgnify:CR=1 FL=1
MPAGSAPSPGCGGLDRLDQPGLSRERDLRPDNVPGRDRQAEELRCKRAVHQDRAGPAGGLRLPRQPDRMAMQMAFDYDLDRPLFVNPTHQFSARGSTTPTRSTSAFLRGGVEYVVPRPPRHQRRPCLSDGRAVLRRLGRHHQPDGLRRPRGSSTYSPTAASSSPTAEPGAKTMIVREVFNDWDTGTSTPHHRAPDTLGRPAKELTRDLLAKGTTWPRAR